MPSRCTSNKTECRNVATVHHRWPVQSRAAPWDTVVHTYSSTKHFVGAQRLHSGYIDTTLASSLNMNMLNTRLHVMLSCISRQKFQSCTLYNTYCTWLSRISFVPVVLCKRSATCLPTHVRGSAGNEDTTSECRHLFDQPISMK